MSLLDHAIWWHVYPLGATGAPPVAADPEATLPRLRRLIDWLDYAIELGCSGLLLGPVFASSTHGYDTLDHFRVDPRLGDEADLVALVEAARERGIAVLLDGVFNHVGREHPLAQRALTEGTDGEYAGFFARGAAGLPLPWEGHGDLLTLNHADPRVADLVVDVMRHWLDRGIAGWRLDVAYAVPAEFWRTVIDRVRADHPEALFVGEMIHGDYAALVRDGHLDSVTQYELWKGTWSAIKDRNLWELAWALRRHDELARTFVPQTFVGNHDVDRIASTIGEAGAVLALVVLMTVAGMPSIYYGDEQAFRGEKGTSWEADRALRPELPQAPDGLADVGRWMFDVHRALIGLRRRHPWLARATTAVVGKDNDWITYESRGAAGQVARVELRLSPMASARVLVDGREEFSWRR